MINFDLVEIALRSIGVYVFIIIAIRFFGKKELSQLSVIDLVFILLISNSVQNAMVGSNVTLQGGLFAALTLFIVNYILKQLLFKSKKLSEIIQGKSVVLIYDGVVQTKNLEITRITKEELGSAIREHGVLDAKNVFLAMLEVDGSISIVSNSLDSKTRHTIKRPRSLRKSIFKK